MMRFSFCRIAAPADPSGPMRLAGAVFGWLPDVALLVRHGD